MGIVFVSILYWIAVAIMFLVGLGQLIFSKKTDQNKTPGLKLLIITVIMVVIGGGACIMLLSGLSIH